jgi:hypothetical protein
LAGFLLGAAAGCLGGYSLHLRLSLGGFGGGGDFGGQGAALLREAQGMGGGGACRSGQKCCSPVVSKN